MKLAVIIAAFALSAFAQGRPVTLSWTASTTPNVTYNVYRAVGQCSGLTSFLKINTTPVTAVTYADSAAIGTYCYRVTAAASGLESVPSNTAEAAVAPTPPNGLTINIAVAVDVRMDGVIVAQREAKFTVPEVR